MIVPATARPTVSVVVPVFNGEASVSELVFRLERTLSGTSSEFELILVNDGSGDGSWDAIEKLSSAHAWVRGLDLARNYGQHNALLAGILEARNDIVVTLDDDLQHPPEEIPKLLDKLAEGYDVVYGTSEEKRQGTSRRLASAATRWLLQSTMRVDVARQQSSFRAFRSSLRESFAHYRGPVVFVDALLTWGTTRFGAVAIHHEDRRAGRSGYSPLKLLGHAINMTSSFSTLPLRLASVVGFAFTLFGVAVLAYVLIRFVLQGVSVQGFTFLASLIAIFSGAQMLAIGIIGEYLARIHLQSMQRPPYAVRARTDAFSSMRRT
jgi:undecaprenyl-phosphate 4-deoxy-4-formamido-L-arabinose transferase